MSRTFNLNGVEYEIIWEWPPVGEQKEYKLVDPYQPGKITHITPPRTGLSAMYLSACNGYAGWKVVDAATGMIWPDVLWVNPDAKQFCTIDMPLRTVGNELATTVHAAEIITADFPAMTFWVRRPAVLVAPLSPGRQADQEPPGKPCADCCQPQACERTGWCAAHRGTFGERAP